MCLEITWHGKVGSPGLPGQPADERLGCLKSIFTSVSSISSSSLSAGSLEAPGPLMLPRFLTWTCFLGSVVQGSRPSTNAAAIPEVQKST